MKGPSIAVMLAGPRGMKHHDEGEEHESSLSETKARAEDAATAFADAVEAKDAKRIVATCRSLYTLCGKLDELEDAGETDDEEEHEKEEDEAESERSSEE